jgi:dihydropteroate synthase
MGVVNVTPDSFSDGGEWFGAEAGVRHGLELRAQGADIVDVGGESTRPGAQRITADEELRRVGPVIGGLAAAGVPVSVDTMRAEVAERALETGARLVNDVSGGLADPQMPRLVASARVPYVVMHWRGHSHSMDSRAVYQDVVAEVSEELCRRVEVVTQAGVDPAMIVLDPGLGFAKRPEHNWALLTHLDEVSSLGGRARPFPVLIGASRRPGRHAPPVRRVGRRHRVGDRPGRRGRGVVRPGAPRPGQRGRGAGGRGVAPGPGRPGCPAGGRMSLDQIALRGLRVHGYHGVLDSERRDGQEFLVDAVLWLDTAAAAASDDLTLTVDYAALADRLAAIVAGPPVRLIETLAQRLADAALAGPLVCEAEITVHKPHAPVGHAFGDVAVTIRRPRP